VCSSSNICSVIWVASCVQVYRDLSHALEGENITIHFLHTYIIFYLNWQKELLPKEEYTTVDVELGAFVDPLKYFSTSTFLVLGE
jgi:hypothetical protein